MTTSKLFLYSLIIFIIVYDSIVFSSIINSALLNQMEKLESREKDKSSQIKRLSTQVTYHKKKTKSLKDLLEDLQEKHLISQEATNVLNVIKRFLKFKF